MIGRTIRSALCAALGVAFGAAPALAGAVGPPMGAIAMHGEPALKPDFDHLPYVNPEAPKGGRLDLAYLGAFDSLNPYNVKALSTAQGLIGNVYQSLMARSADEPFTLYGLIAKSLETDEARDACLSTSIRPPGSRMERRSPRPTSSSPSISSRPRAGRSSAPPSGWSKPSMRPTIGPWLMIFPAPTTASCR